MVRYDPKRLLLALCCVTVLIYKVDSTEYVASLSMNGVVGEITFVPVGKEVYVTISMNSHAINYNQLEIKEFPAMFGGELSHNDACKQLGGTILSLTGISSGSTRKLNVSGDEIFHRSVCMSGGGQPVCATILTRNDFTATLRAKFVGPIAGDVWLRKRRSRNGMYILTNLAYGTEYSLLSGNSSYSLVQFSRGYINQQNDFTKRCHTLSHSSVVVPHLVVGTSVSQENRQASLVPGMVAIHKHIGIKRNNDVIACAAVSAVAAKTVRSEIEWDNVLGFITISQNSLFDVTETKVELTGLQYLPIAYHVHKFPVTQRRNADDQRCSAGNVGGHFNPYGVINFPASGTEDQFEVGDLSSKYGKISTNIYDAHFYDWNLPLFGPNSVVGRSIVLHRSDGSRWVCANIDYPGVVTTAVVRFKSPAYGAMYFRQSRGKSRDDTSVYINLANLDGVMTKAHNFHVHVYPVGADCGSTGPHYNPSKVSTSGDYSSQCSANNPLRCELGDLSGRHEAIDISETLRDSGGKYFFTDTSLPLSGPYNVIGRSVVVHIADKGAPRYACGNITWLRTEIAESNRWEGDDNNGGISGIIKILRESEFDVSKIQISVNGHRRTAVDIQIHELPYLATAQGLDKCTSVSDVFNPFNTSQATAGQTTDHYAVGDLSGKFGKLYLNGYNLRALDGNLPLSQDVGVAGRSVVIYDHNSQPWKCARIDLVPADSTGYVIEAQVLFSTVFVGYIRMRQVIYTDGSASSTSIEVGLSYDNPTMTTTNNWHVHIDPVTVESECAIALGHYNPYAVNVSSPIYGSRKTEPCTFEIGDLSGKHGPYTIGGGRKYYLDENLPLHTEKTVLGRSMVFHVEGGAPRIACANIMPLTNLYTFQFSSSIEYDNYRFTATIANALKIHRLQIVVLRNTAVPLTQNGCSRVLVYIAGNVEDSLIQSALKGENMWPYVSTKKCGSHIGSC